MTRLRALALQAFAARRARHDAVRAVRQQYQQDVDALAALRIHLAEMDTRQ